MWNSSKLKTVHILLLFLYFWHRKLSLRDEILFENRTENVSLSLNPQGYLRFDHPKSFPSFFPIRTPQTRSRSILFFLQTLFSSRRLGWRWLEYEVRRRLSWNFIPLHPNRKNYITLMAFRLRLVPGSKVLVSVIIHKFSQVLRELVLGWGPRGLISRDGISDVVILYNLFLSRDI